MSHKAAIAAAVLTVVGTPIFAQGITGGQLGVEYNMPTDGSDFGGTTYSGGLEYAITRQISVSVDATGYATDNLDISGSNISLHGIYHLSDSASAGVFIGSDKLEDADESVTVYGVEGGTEFMGGAVGGYLGFTDSSGVDSTVFGADGAYALSNGFSVVGGLDVLSSDADTTVSRLTLGAQYEIQGGPELYAHVGNVSASDTSSAADQTFIGIGARVAFGAQRGTTFEGHSIFDAVAGF